MGAARPCCPPDGLSDRLMQMTAMVLIDRYTKMGERMCDVCVRVCGAAIASESAASPPH